MSKPTVVTITGIRPDFIRMAEIFKLLDERFNHILIHTGQHTDALLSDVFFDELNIREPDYTLNARENGNEHFHQLSYLSTKVIELFREKNIKPQVILFLGDSNTVPTALALRKEGYTIGHIEAGMRSFDKRMLEEINRTVCDHCSHILFVYHNEYKKYLANENIKDNVYVVGNTIVEVCKPFVPERPKENSHIILDVHRPENFKYKTRMENIIKYANQCIEKYGVPVYMLKFHRTAQKIKEFGIDLGKIQVVPLMAYKKYLNSVYDSKFIISDSGTAQEEPALLGTPVVVPRDFTERPQSMDNNCSFMLNVNSEEQFEEADQWLQDHFDGKLDINIEWLGDGNTAQLVVDELDKFLGI